MLEGRHKNSTFAKYFNWLKDVSDLNHSMSRTSKLGLFLTCTFICIEGVNIMEWLYQGRTHNIHTHNTTYLTILAVKWILITFPANPLRRTSSTEFAPQLNIKLSIPKILRVPEYVTKTKTNNWQRVGNITYLRFYDTLLSTLCIVFK